MEKMGCRKKDENMIILFEIEKTNEEESFPSFDV